MAGRQVQGAVPCGCAFRGQMHADTGYRSAAMRQWLKQVVVQKWQAISERTVQMCVREAKHKFSAELAIDDSFCKYDGYYYFGVALSSGIYFALLQALIVPYNVAQKLYHHATVAPIVFSVVQTLNMCVSAATTASAASRDGGIAQTTKAMMMTTACTTMVTAIGTVLNTNIGKLLTKLLLDAMKVGAMTARKAGNFLHDHWDHIRPVYIAHLLRTASMTSAVRTEIQKVGEIGPGLFHSIIAALAAAAKTAPLLLPAQKPLLLTYKPGDKAEAQVERSSRRASK
jgi:hypothetical protein